MSLQLHTKTFISKRSFFLPFQIFFRKIHFSKVVAQRLSTFVHHGDTNFSPLREKMFKFEKKMLFLTLEATFSNEMRVINYRHNN